MIAWGQEKKGSFSFSHRGGHAARRVPVSARKPCKEGERELQEVVCVASRTVSQD